MKNDYSKCFTCCHNGVFWQNSGCNLLNNGEHCEYARDCHRGIYKITDITNLDGTKRTDDKYPLRIGCIGLLDISDEELE